MSSIRKLRILVADDHAILRSIISLALERQGYDVVSASNGREAADRWRQQVEAFDLTILDVCMPEMNGYETFRLLSRGHPEAKFLFVSGTADPEMWRKIQSLDQVGYLHKPFRTSELIDAVRRILGDVLCEISAADS